MQRSLVGSDAFRLAHAVCSHEQPLIALSAQLEEFLYRDPRLVALSQEELKQLDSLTQKLALPEAPLVEEPVEAEAEVEIEETFMNLPSRGDIQAELQYRAEHKLCSFYPETGPLRRELYPKHLMR